MAELADAAEAGLGAAKYSGAGSADPHSTATAVLPQALGTRDARVVGSIDETGFGGLLDKVWEGALDLPAAGGTGIAGDVGLADPLAAAAAVWPKTVGTRDFKMVEDDTCADGSLRESLEGALGISVVEGICVMRDSDLIEMLVVASAVPPKTAGTREVLVVGITEEPGVGGLLSGVLEGALDIPVA